MLGIELTHRVQLIAIALLMWGAAVVFFCVLSSLKRSKNTQHSKVIPHSEPPLASIHTSPPTQLYDDIQEVSALEEITEPSSPQVLGDVESGEADNEQVKTVAS